MGPVNGPQIRLKGPTAGGGGTLTCAVVWAGSRLHSSRRTQSHLSPDVTCDGHRVMGWETHILSGQGRPGHLGGFCPHRPAGHVQRLLSGRFHFLSPSLCIPEGCPEGEARALSCLRGTETCLFNGHETRTAVCQRHLWLHCDSSRGTRVTPSLATGATLPTCHWVAVRVQELPYSRDRPSRP